MDEKEKKEEDQKLAESNVNYIGRHTKTFFSFKT
jgi:hypothetical protein